MSENPTRENRRRKLKKELGDFQKARQWFVEAEGSQAMFDDYEHLYNPSSTTMSIRGSPNPFS